MIYRTIAARDNVTISADIDEHDYVNAVADLANQALEDKREVLAQAMTDLMIFGRCQVPL